MGINTGDKHCFGKIAQYMMADSMVVSGAGFCVCLVTFR